MKPVSFFFLLLHGCCLTIAIDALSPPCLAQVTERERLRQQQLTKQRAAEQERQQQLAKERAAEQERLRQQQLAKQRAAEQERQQQLAKERAAEQERLRQQQLAKQRAAEQERQQQLAKERASQQLSKPLSTKAPQVDGTKSSFQQANGPVLRSYTKNDALANLKLWLNLNYCHSGMARDYNQLQNAGAGNSPTAWALQKFYERTLPGVVTRQIDQEVKQYENKSIAEIDSRTKQIQDKLGTTDPIKAYRNSYCNLPR
jgi:hypothetical protein